MAIAYFSQGTAFKIKNPKKIAKWIAAAAGKEQHAIEQLNYIFCTDRQLLKINREYLNHNTLTDIITFDNSERPGKIEADIFISVQRVRENAKELDQNFDQELRRVMIHGVLHLVGHSDKTPNQKARMRKKEEAYLSLY